MSIVRSFAAGLRALFHKDDRNRDIDEELQGYLDASVAHRVSRGMSPDQALQAARAEMGSTETVKEKVWTAGWESAAGSTWRNIRFGLRMLARNKSFTAVAILALALGIGPNVAIFSIVWATFLAPLPYPQPNQLVVVWSKANGQRIPVRADDYLEYVRQSKSFQRLDFSGYIVVHLTDENHVQDEISGESTTPGMFTELFQEHMALGRDLLPQEGVPGNDHVVILSHRLWLERYHSDPAIVGKPIKIDDQPYTVVGVENPGPADRHVNQFTVPLALSPGGHNQVWGIPFGRLKPGVTLEQAQAELSVIDRRLEAARSSDGTKDVSTISVEPLRNDWLDKKLERNLWLLLAAVGFILLIACADLANLLLARGSSRQQELAVRSAIGATRWQVFTQLVTESLTLAVIGGAIGIALGWVMLKAAIAILPDLKTQSAEAVIQLNLPVLYFAVGVTLLAGLIFGCAPAWQAAKLNLSETLKQGSRSVTSRGRMHTQAMLVTAEFALALTLLAGAGMTLHSFWNLSRIDIGVRIDHILMGQILVPRSAAVNTSFNPDQLNADARELLTKVESVPGVESSALATNMPLNGNGSFPFAIVGHPVTADNRPTADFQIVTPSYFSVFGVHLVRGRFLNDEDRSGSPQCVVISQSFVDRYFPGIDPLGQRLLLGKIVLHQDHPGAASEWQIVGVFHDIRNGNHLSDKTAPQIFAPYWQSPWPYMGLAVRTSVHPGIVTRGVRDTVAQTFSGYSLSQISTMQQTIDTQLVGDRFGMVLFGGFAVLALLLSAVGIYGVMAFVIAQRSHEIGLRMALGAQRRDVVLMMLSHGMKLALTGVGIGIIGVYLLGYLMRSTLYGIQTIDAASFIAVALTLLAVAVVATWVPARRSAKVDPMIALRQE